MRPLISSVQNERVKAVAKLRDRAARDAAGLFLIDGEQEINRALACGIELYQLFVPETSLEDAAILSDAAQSAGCEVFPVTSAVLEKIAYGKRSDQLVASAMIPDVSLAAFERAVAKRLATRPGPLLFLVLDQVEKPGNVGAAARTADAVGATGIVLADGRTDPFNPNAVRAARGALFSVPLAVASAAETIAWLRATEVKLFAARVDGSVPYATRDFRGPTAFILGSEAAGLGEAWRGAEIKSIHLPLHGVSDSLNVSVTAAVLLYETLRQRGG